MYTNPEKSMNSVHAELEAEYKSYFEAILANQILLTPQLFTNAINKISTAVIKFILENELQILEQLRILFEEGKVNQELLNENIYGKLSMPSNFELSKTNQEKAENYLLTLFLDTLRDKHGPIEQKLVVHQFFIYRLYDVCQKEPDAIAKKQKLVSKIFNPKFFDEKERGRYEQDNFPKSKNENPGTINNSVLSKLAGKAGVIIPNVCAPKDKFAIDNNASFVKKLRENHLAAASGVSGHVGSCLLGALMYGNLTNEEKQEYLLVLFAFLTIARAHTFHEAIVVGETVGFTCFFKSYANIPSSLWEHSEFTSIKSQFPDLIHNDESGDTIVNENLENTYQK